MILTGDLILESVLRGISFPSDNANNLDDDDILAFAYEEMVSKICPLVTSLRQEYLIAPPITIDLVDDTQRYRIPQRALGRTIRDIIFVDANGGQRPLRLVSPEQKTKYMPMSDSAGVPQAAYIENDYIVILPIPDGQTGAYLEVTYPFRPSKLIKTTDCGVIQSVDSTTGTIILEAAVTDFTTSTPLDIVSHTSGNIIRAISITPTTVATYTLTFTVGDFDANVAVGDYVCLAEESPVAPIPEEALIALARATQNRILESIDDLEGLAMGQKILFGDGKNPGLMANLAELLTPRVESKPLIARGAANKYFLQSKGGSYFPRIRVTGD